MPPWRLSTRAALFLAPVAVLGQIYVSPAGDDANAGTLGAPYATLVRAVDAARAVRAERPAQDESIILRGGTYRLDRTLVLGLEDSPPPGHTLTFSAYPGETPVISSGVPVRGWRKLGEGETPAALAPAARGHVWVADLPETKGGAWHFHALYDGFTALPRARSPQYLSLRPHAGLADRLRYRDVLEFPKGSVKAWDNLSDVEILARPNHDWLVNYLGIASVDEAAGTAHTTVPATYTLSGRFWVENVLEALDHPGAWVLNTKEGELYLWPAGDSPGENIVAPRLETLIRVEGKEGCLGEPDRPAGGFRFERLTFAHTDRDTILPNDAGLQHDWEQWDKDDACLRFRVARDCSVSGCTFTAAGDNGVRADLFAQGIRIDGNTFRELGGGGVLFAGYGPGTKDVNRGNEIVDNEFTRLGMLTWHSPAVFLWQSGHNRVAHNYIHDLPYNGMVLDGVRPRNMGVATPKVPDPTFPPDMREDLHLIRWKEIGWPRTIEDTLPFEHCRDNVVSDNEICDVMKVLKDGNAIYLSAAGKGNLIERNVIYRMNGSAAIRTDDDQSYVSITQNVVIGGGIVIKDYNFTWNNILVDTILSIISDRPDSRVDHNVFASLAGPPRFYRYDLVNSYFGNAKNDATLKNFNSKSPKIVPPKTDHNLFYATDLAAARAFMDGMRKTMGCDADSACGDPLLRDPARGDFRFALGSPAAALGIESVDTTGVGLLKDPMVRRLQRTGGMILPTAAEVEASAAGPPPG